MTLYPQIASDRRRIGYARVSTKDQKLRMQLDALTGVGCEPIFEDHGISGAKSSRPGLDALLSLAQSGDSVIVLKLDRLGRSVVDLADLLVRFHDSGIFFCSLTEGINTATPGGKMVYHLFAAIAEFQRDLIVENTVMGIEAARKRGRRLGRPCLLDCDAATLAHKAITQDGICPASLAESLGVSRITLDRALKRHGLNPAAHINP
mgnify:CR=1 FL=1